MESEIHTFNLDKDTFEILKKQADQKKLSMSAVLRTLILEVCQGGTQ